VLGGPEKQSACCIADCLDDGIEICYSFGAQCDRSWIVQQKVPAGVATGEPFFEAGRLSHRATFPATFPVMQSSARPVSREDVRLSSRLQVLYSETKHSAACRQQNR
jgi:hypothetical protein